MCARITCRQRQIFGAAGERCHHTCTAACAPHAHRMCAAHMHMRMHMHMHMHMHMCTATQAVVVDGVQHAGWCSPLDEPTASAPGRKAKGTGRGKAHARGKGRGKQATTVDGGGGGGGGEDAWQSELVGAAHGPADLRLPALPPALTAADELQRLYRGPTKRSNWVIPGRVLAGDRSAVDGATTLDELVATGVDTFVCLQTKGELANLPPYAHRARAARARRAGIAATDTDGAEGGAEGGREGGGEGGGKATAWFRSLPIVDQQVTADDLVSELVDDLLQRLAAGRVLYVHCRGGHGRTGTVCALLLGRAYGIGAAEAMARYQWYHDTRQQPVFHAEGYALNTSAGGGASCVALFAEQRQQISRLLAAGGASPEPATYTAPETETKTVNGGSVASAGGGGNGGDGGGGGVATEDGDSGGGDGAAVALPIAPRRGRSERYGAGASLYEEEELIGWKDVGQRAAAAVRGRQWDEANALTRASIAVRPDWCKGYLCLALVLRRQERPAQAAAALREGLRACAGNSKAEAELLAALGAQRDASGAEGGTEVGAEERPGSAAADEGAVAHAAMPVQVSVDAAGHTAGDNGVDGVGGGDSDSVDGAGSVSSVGGGGGGKRGGSASRALPRFVCLVGLPAAGKSTFAQALVDSDSAWVRISEDWG